MNLNAYQREAQKTDRVPSRSTERTGVDLMVPLLGLAGETGELLSEYKKHLRDGDSHLLFKDRTLRRHLQRTKANLQAPRQFCL